MNKKAVLGFLKIAFAAICLVLPFYESIAVFANKKAFPEIVFKEKSAEMGMSFEHRGAMDWIKEYTRMNPQVTKWFQAVSASVAVADVNGDGWMDVFLSSSSYKDPSHLYINQQGESFEEKAEEYGLAHLPSPIRSLFLDCDNDGELEFFTSTPHCPIVYKKDSSGKYQKMYDFPTGAFCMFSTAINVLDYNRDGLVDLIFANLTRNSLPNSPVDADNGGDAVLLKNEGQCRFSVDEKALSHDFRTHVNAVGIGDLYGDGSQDIWLGTDFNNDWIYKQKGSTYERLDPLSSKTLAHNGMSSEWAYLEGTRRPYVFISHIFEPGFFTAGNVLWTVKDDTLKDYGRQFGVDRCGWAWGSRFVDMNNDSHEDLLVTNGFISEDTDKSAFFRVRTASSMPRELAPVGSVWATFEKLSYAGNQRDCFFMNDGKNNFYDIAEDVGFDPRRLDGRGLATADFNNDGRIDVVVANQRQPVQLYLNESLMKSSWIGFKLQGTVSSREAAGANVYVKLKSGRTLRKALYPLNGYSAQSDSRVHFGLGDEEIQDVTVVWLSGITQKLDGYRVNEYNQVVEKPSEGTGLE